MKATHVRAALRNCASQLSSAGVSGNSDHEVVLITLPWDIPLKSLDGLGVPLTGGTVKIPATGKSCSLSIHGSTSSPGLAGSKGSAGDSVAGSPPDRFTRHTGDSALKQFFAGMFTLPKSENDCDESGDESSEDEDVSHKSEERRAVRGSKFARTFSRHFQFAHCPVPSLTLRKDEKKEKSSAPRTLRGLGVSGYPLTAIPQIPGLRQRFAPPGATLPDGAGCGTKVGGVVCRKRKRQVQEENVDAPKGSGSKDISRKRKRRGSDAAKRKVKKKTAKKKTAKKKKKRNR